MKKLYPVFVFVASAIWLQAQITVTSATFPMAGDTLKTAVDITPSGVDITPSGGPTTWDFTGLTPTYTQQVVFRVATEGNAFAEFPGADLVSTYAGSDNETYYNVSSSTFSNLGFSGSDPSGSVPIQATFKFNPPVPERRSPLNFFDVQQAETNLTVPFALSDIPGNILDSLGIPTSLADSVRIRVTAQRLDVVDAYGTLAIPGGTYDVLREKRTEYRQTSIDIHTFLGWIDVTSQAGGGFGQDTTVSYVFMSDTEKEPIAVVQLDSTQSVAQTVDYKDNGVVNGSNYLVTSKPVVTISPNPASSVVMFDLKDVALGTYSLRLFDLTGKQVLARNLTVGSQPISLENLGIGTYFYQVFDEKNQAITSGKLLKINE